ncbi:MAG: hydroxyacylglutathione hydrolase [Proteobacteria bacterium]|nr:hydroxyacylglutathione hydrolase [Pseudomonadota bacterium]
MRWQDEQGDVVQSKPSSLHVEPVACLRDNYAYLLLGEKGDAAVVDPSEAEPVERALQRHGAKPGAIWLTHHHWDHVGGVARLRARYGAIDVVGSTYDLAAGRIEHQTRGVAEGDRLMFSGLPVSLLELPGHTLGALAYYVDGCLFTGDTLFLAGCGRLFEGTPELMYRSLLKVRSLPPDTRIYCGHEYTLDNLRFAAVVEPDNAAITQRMKWAQARLRAGEATVPGRLADELATNPFLRCECAPVVASARRLDARAEAPSDVLGVIRQAKDRF